MLILIACALHARQPSGYILGTFESSYVNEAVYFCAMAGRHSHELDLPPAGLDLCALDVALFNDEEAVTSLPCYQFAKGGGGGAANLSTKLKLLPQ